MDLWRLCRRPFADLTGTGARRWGGRWNSPGRPVVYLAEHPALAAMEVRVHLDLPFELLPEDFVLMRVSIPNTLVATLEVPPMETVALGDAWLKEERSAGLRVPSILVPHGWNVLLNPNHPNAGRARVATIERFDFDPRLWRPRGAEG
jgi:RES domain-containing protein